VAETFNRADEDWANLITRSIAGETVILDGASGRYIRSMPASCIWEACDRCASAEIVAQVNQI
jgi:hypothetical protein